MKVKLIPAMRGMFQTVSVFFIGLAALIIMSVNMASALERNSIRIGDDYRIFNMEEGARARACERRCQKETKCRAWTFIRERVKRKKGITFNLGNGLSFNLGGHRHERIIPAQCRLKHSVGRSRPNDCCVSGVVRNMDDADRGEEDRCSRLAKHAVVQNDKNLARGCGFRGRLWSSSYSRLFDRCIRRGADHFRRLERKRRNALAQCRRGGSSTNGPGSRRCREFADMMVSFGRSNKKNDCGFEGSTWSSDYDRHYNRCRRNRNQREDNRQVRDHRDKIRVCLARGGGAFNKTCDNFANTAVRQQRKNRKNNCGFTGARWHDSHRRHYKTCRKLSRWRRSREEKARTRSLRQCLRDGENKREICEKFADGAMRDQRKNLRLRCKFRRKTRWHTNRERHIRICMDLSDRERRVEVDVKRKALDKCERKNGVDNVKNAFCKDYANVAIDQNRENIKSRCHYTSSLWSDSYRDHYAWCLSSPERSSKDSRRRRREKLTECQVEGDVDRSYNWKRKSKGGGGGKRGGGGGKQIRR